MVTERKGTKWLVILSLMLQQLLSIFIKDRTKKSLSPLSGTYTFNHKEFCRHTGVIYQHLLAGVSDVKDDEFKSIKIIE
jgi:hypothetical protein